MALPAALKRKETIDPSSPGRSEAVVLTRSFKPFQSAFPVAFKALVMTPMIAPIVAPAATKMAATVTPYFLKMSLILSRSGSALSLPSIWVLNRASSSCLSLTLPSAASLSEGEVSSFLIIPLSCSLCF